MTIYSDTSLNLQIQKMLEVQPDRKKKTGSMNELRASVIKGLPFSAFEAVQNEIDLPQNQLSAILRIPTRTIARRKESQQLSSEESDRLYRVAHVFVFTVSVLGDNDKARTWLKSPNRGLGGEIPLNLLDTEIGSRQVEDALQRIQYGIYG